jgi:hypothetical protein
MPAAGSSGQSLGAALARAVQPVFFMKDPRRRDPAPLVWLMGSCLLLAGGAACASGGAPLGQVVTLLLGVLATAGLSSLMVSGCRGQRAPISGDSGTDTATATPDAGGDTSSSDAAPSSYVCGADSLPPDAAGAGWIRCCVGGQIRACPPPPPTVACNFGWNETYCEDGLTCGLTWMNPCDIGKVDAGSPDSTSDSAPDTGALPDAATDAAADMSPASDGATDLTTDVFVRCGEGSRPADGGMPADGWLRCCMDRQIRWCPPQPPTIACNYGQGQTFCADGVTCGWQTENPCGVVDGGSAEVRE